MMDCHIIDSHMFVVAMILLQTLLMKLLMQLVRLGLRGVFLVEYIEET